MATNTLDTHENICNAALALLRQDAWYSESASAAYKCDQVWNIAWENVRTAFKWTSTMGSPSDTPPTDTTLRALLVYSLARELAIPITGRQEDLKTIAALYGDKLAEAKLKDLNARLADETSGSEIDSVLAQLIGNFKRDDPALVAAWEVYTQRKDAVETDSVNTVNALLKNEKVSGAYPALTDAQKEAATLLSVIKLSPACGLDPNFVQLKQQEYDGLTTECLRSKLNTVASADVTTSSPSSGLLYESAVEVKKTLGIGDSTFPSDGLAVACARTLCYAKNGEAYKYDSKFCELKMQEYAAKIVQWRKLKLEDERSSDDVLDQLVGAFKGDDTALCNAWTSYTARKTNVVTLCDAAAKKDFDVDNLADVSQAAANCMAVAKLAPAFGLDANFSALQMKEYERLLAEHKRRTLDEEATRDVSSSFTSGLLYDCWLSVQKTLEYKNASGTAVVPATSDRLAVDCARALCYAKNGTRYGYDAQFVQLKQNEYGALVVAWRKVQLDRDRASDEVLDQLVGAFKGDDTALCNAWTSYTARKTKTFELCQNAVLDLCSTDSASNLTGLEKAAVNTLAVAKLSPAFGIDGSAQMAEYEKMATEILHRVLKNIVKSKSASDGLYKDCLDEVKTTLGWTNGQTVDGIMVGAAQSLCYARNAAAYRYDEEFAKTKLAEYDAKILLWRKLKIDAETGVDSVLAQLVQNFKGGDQALANAFASYTQKAANVKTLCTAAAKEDFGVSDSTLTGVPALAADCLAVAKLAPTFGLDQTAQMAEYNKLLEEYKRNELDEDADDETSTTFTSCLDEVKHTLGWTTGDDVDALMKAAAKCLCYVRKGPSHFYEAAFVNTKEQEYQAKILQWRKVKLDAAMKTNTDPVLALLVANFKGDDAALVNAFATYTQRINTVKDTIRDAILAAHHWAFARKSVAFVSTRPSDCIRVLDVIDASGTRLAWSIAGSTISADSSAATLVYTARSEASTWPASVRSAYTAAVAAEIAQGVVSTPETAAQTKAYFDKLAAERLAAARVADLNEDASGSDIVREVKNVIKSEARLGDADLDESATALAERIAANLEPARLEVLAAHNWNFARTALQVAPCETPDGRFAFTRPADALRISSVRTLDDRVLGYTIDGANVLCQEPPHTVTYVRESMDVDDFPPLVRRALVYRLASDVAVSLPQRKGNPEYFLNLYREKLAAAATADARESNPGRSAWGGSSYVDAMRGSFPRERARYPFHR